MKKRLSVLLAAALFAALLLTGCPNKDKAPDASGEELSAAAVTTTAAAAGETDAEPGSTGSADSGEPAPSDTVSADASSSVGGAEASAENTSHQTAQTKAGNAAQTTAKQTPAQTRPAQTTSTTKGKQTTAAKPLAALPLKAQWILKPSLAYDRVVPTSDGKNWIGKRSGEYVYDLMNTAGKVLARAGYMESGDGKTYGDRIIACKEEKYALLSSEGKTILDYQAKVLIFYDNLCLMLTGEGTESGGWTIVNRSGKTAGKYDGVVGYGASSDDIYLIDRTKKLYSATVVDLEGTDFYAFRYLPVICTRIPKKCIALVGERINPGAEDEFENISGWGAVINGELKSTTLYEVFTLLKSFDDWRRDLYIAETDTESLFTNTAGQAVLTEKFSGIFANENCTAAAVKQNGKWGFIRIPEL